jgi:hypothetical protein
VSTEVKTANATVGDDLTFTTATRRNVPIVFNLDDRQYKFNAQKTAGPVIRVLMEGESDLIATMEWMRDSLTDEDWKHIVSRLKDPDDSLDTDNVLAIGRKLLSVVAGRPLE